MKISYIDLMKLISVFSPKKFNFHLRRRILAKTEINLNLYPIILRERKSQYFLFPTIIQFDSAIFSKPSFPTNRLIEIVFLLLANTTGGISNFSTHLRDMNLANSSAYPLRRALSSVVNIPIASCSLNMAKHRSSSFSALNMPYPPLR